MTRSYGTPVHLDDLDATRLELEHRLTSTAPFLFRVEAVRYSYIVNAEAEEYGSTDPRLEVFALEVRNWTQHGASLKDFSGAKPRWVDLRSGAKQYASRTIAEAVKQFALRRKRQIYILERQLARAKAELNLIKGRNAVA